MLKKRRSHDCLIFNMGIPIPGKDGLYIETGPRGPFQYSSRHLIVRFHEVLKPKYLCNKIIQNFCLHLGSIVFNSNFKMIQQSGSCETSQDLMIKHLFWYWNRHHGHCWKPFSSSCTKLVEQFCQNHSHFCVSTPHCNPSSPGQKHLASNHSVICMVVYLLGPWHYENHSNYRPWYTSNQVCRLLGHVTVMVVINSIWSDDYIFMA